MPILFNTKSQDADLEQLIRKDAENERITPTAKLRQIVLAHYATELSDATVEVNAEAENVPHIASSND